MRAAVVAAAGGRRTAGRNQPKGLLGVLATSDAGRIGLGPDQDEIVEHHIAAVNAVPLRDELVLSLPIMDEDGIGVASCANRKRLPGADRDDVHRKAGG